MKNPLVSVLINNYNKENFCEKAVKSVLNQNYKKIEIIFYDDCSPDFSLAKIQRLKKKLKLKKLKIIKNKLRGKIASFNQIEGVKKSLKKAKGKIICLLDSDDFFKKNKIKSIVEFFKKNKKIEVIFDRPIYYYDKKNMDHCKINFRSRENKWPIFSPTSCISIQKKSLDIALKKTSINRYPHVWLDFRIACYFAFKNMFIVKSDFLTFYRQIENSADKNYIKFFNRNWWVRRNQSFEFLKYMDLKRFNKSKKTLDFFITKTLNKFFC